MTDKIAKFIERLAPDPVCDDCVAERLELPEEDAGRAALELAATNAFERRRGACTLCGRAMLTTRFR
jgi:hypothetical protein